MREAGASIPDMDLVIPLTSHPKPGYLYAPMLNFRCAGVKGFWSVVSRLTESDLGESCNQEWRKRLARLSGCTRIVGGHGSLSKPCELPPGLRPFVAETSRPLATGSAT